MNKRLLCVGVVTIGFLLLGSLSIPVAAQDDGGPDMSAFEGVIDLISDISLTNNWMVGPTTGPARSDLTNTNLRYSVTSMKSPLDQYINVGFFMGGDASSGPVPEFKIDGTFEGSELFVKIVNDQQSISDPLNRLLDWQAVLTLGEDINISMNLPPEIADQGVPIDLIPTSVVIPAGAGTPPFPVVSSTANFSSFEDLSEMASWYGYDGLPFVSPAIFYVEDVDAAFSYWNSEVDLDKLFPPADSPEKNNSVTVIPTLTSVGLELSIEAKFFNQSADHGNISIMGVWDQTTGWLTHFEIELFADLDQSKALDASEEFSFVFDMLEYSPPEPSPIKVGDSGEYILNIDLTANVVLENATENQRVNEILPQIVDSIIELDGQPLLNFTVDAMDGLYYHLDGYMLDFNGFLEDRFVLLFGDSQEPLPLLKDYYHGFNDNMDQWGTSDFAINLFDAQMYQNTTQFLRRSDGWAQNNRTIEIHDWNRGIMNARVYERNDWEMHYDNSTSFEENLDTTSAIEVYNGPVDYVEVEEMYWDDTLQSWIPTGHTYTNVQINNSNENFVEFSNYVLILDIENLPGSGFTSYVTKNNFMSMFGGGEPMNAGMGAQEDPVPQEGFRLPIDPQMVIPMPMRTPDWDKVGGAVILMEAYVDQLAAVITNPDFIAALTNMPMDDPGDSLAIHTFNIDLNWIDNATYVGAEAFFELDMTQVDNDTGVLAMVTTDAHIITENHYFWTLNGAFASMRSYSSVHVAIDSVDYTPGETTPIDTTVDTTTTDVKLSPGFEAIFVLGSMIALPIFLRKRK